jgi:cobalt-zinc-cadmium efflux system outer membrane protein
MNLINAMRSPLAIGTMTALLLSGCVLAPKEAKDERQRLRTAGTRFQEPFDKRSLPELSSSPATLDVLRRGLLVNGEVEAAYFQWAVAVSRIDQAGAYPNSPLSIGFEQAMERGRIRSFDDTTITAGPDAMENLAFPSKVAKAGEVAFDEARAAGRQFIATKLTVQKRVLDAWFDFALLAEKIRVQRQNLSLLRIMKETTASRFQSGASQPDLLKADVAVQLATNQLASLEADLLRQRAMLNGLLARSVEAPLEPPGAIPAPRLLAADDASLLAAAARNNPELQSLGHSIAGREDALDLARMQYIPDFNPFAGITGSTMQFIGLGVSLPTVLPRIRGMIEESRAELGAAEATYRQKRQDTAAALVAALVTLRNSERQSALFKKDVIPLVERVVDSVRRGYVAGGGTYLDLIDAQRTLLDARLMLAESLVAREKALTEIEVLAGFDLEAIAAGSSQPTTVSKEIHHD